MEEVGGAADGGGGGAGSVWVRGAELGGLVGVVFLGEVECADVVAVCGCVDLQKGAVVPLERGG